jgi:hypothetical protein
MREEKRRETSDKPSVMIVVINMCSNVNSISSWWAVGEVKLVRLSGIKVGGVCREVEREVKVSDPELN